MRPRTKANLLSQMENNFNSYSNKGIDLITKNINEICIKFNLCDTKNKIQSLNLEASKNFNDICNAYNSLSNEIKFFNDNEAKRYNTELEELNTKNKKIRDKNVPIQKEIDGITKINDLKENLNQEATKIEKNVLDSLKQANLLGKTVDVSKYSKKADEYNSLKLEEKSLKIKELQDAANEIQTQSDSIKSQQTGILEFFKKIYYGIFGEKQKLETKIQLESNLTLPKFIPETPNNITIARNAKIESEISKFFADSCQTSSSKLTEMQANTMNIQVSDKQSQIKTNVKETEKNCFDEKGQRTNKCCDRDDYKSRKNLYPVIFVHGHSFETARGDIQNSLSTFNYMSKYFSQNGYVEESLLYPESTEQLAQGVWAFCDKPVVIRLTYYDGLASGTTHNYKSSISDYSPVLKKEIENVLKATNKDKAIIVSHSMGGILSRYYIKFDGGSSEVYKLITVSSPHYGIRAWASFWSPFGAKESQQMTPNSAFLNLLNNPTDSLVPSYTIGGNDKSCFTEDCDGVVYVSSSKLKTAVKSVIFNEKQYEHNLILSQPDVAQQVLDFILNNVETLTSPSVWTLSHSGDLSNYPSPFIRNGRFSGMLVVGDKAAGEEVIAVSDIISSLQFIPVGTAIQRIEVGAAKLTSEISDITAQNSILVGNACSNNIIKEIIGGSGDCLSHYTAGEGKIELYEHPNGNVALIVSGYTVLDTRNAAGVLANYKDYKGQLKGNNVRVKRLNDQLIVD